MKEWFTGILSMVHMRVRVEDHARARIEGLTINDAGNFLHHYDISPWILSFESKR